MTDKPPITPPPELVGQWLTEVADLELLTPSSLDYLATKAAQWGYQQAAERFPHIANQELESCCNWLGPLGIKGGNNLRLARRPKPPSLKGQALDALGPEPRPETGPTGDTILNHGVIKRHRLVRRALEVLPFRSLCANLTIALNDWQHESGDDRYADLIDRARTALAEQPVTPTDEELLSMRSWSSFGPTFDSDLVDFARAILARWGHP